MARNRQVFPRDNVAHLWAHGVQDSARDAAHNFYFNGPTLYSYGTHFVIAHILRGAEYGKLAGLVLWNDAGYSNTTSKHQTIAWRALTQQQTQTRLHVPKLSSDEAREIDYAIRSRKLPEKYIKDLLARIQSDIAAIAGKRHGSGPFCSLMHTARMYERTARALYSVTARKYPLPILPESNDGIPAGKDERAEFIRSFSRQLVAMRYTEAIDNASRYLKTAQHESTSQDGQRYQNPQDEHWIVAGTYDVAQKGLRFCDAAADEYAILHGAQKKSAKVAALRKALTPIAERYAAMRHAADNKIKLERLNQFTRAYYRMLRQAKRHGGKVSPHDLPGYVNRARDDMHELGISPESTIGHAVMRAVRADDVATIDRTIRSMRSAFASAESYGEQWPSDALRSYAQVISYGQQLAHRGMDGSARYALHAMKTGDVASMLMDAETRADAMRVAVKAREAARIADWINGTSNVAPSYTAGTYARIRGGMVETSHGASVPIEHACRLARVYARIVRAGGASWADGAGPMVGHYRVNRIGADGSLVIGCHEFNPDEAQRLHDVMAQCAECQSIKGE